MSEIDELIESIFQDHAGPFFFVGSGKNAGKTTLLNRVNRVLSPMGIGVGVTTIGHDGEPFDAVLGHAKPAVEVFRGNVVCLTEAMAADAGHSLRVIAPTGFETPVGRLVLARCVVDARVEILGPETNTRCLEVCRRLEQFGARVVLVDGAFHRRTQIAIRDRTALALVVSGDLADSLAEIEAYVRYFVELFTLPRVAGAVSDWAGDLGTADVDEGRGVAVLGPLTETLAQEMTGRVSGRPLYLEDATKVFCAPQTFARLRAASAGIFVERDFDLRLIAANPTARLGSGFTPSAFAEAIKRGASHFPVVDVVAGIVR